jgi:hypothetical protein
MSGRSRGRNEPAAAPQPGSGCTGHSASPLDMPEESSDIPSTVKPKEAPAPGVPVSNEEYERMKEEAKRARTGSAEAHPKKTTKKN